MPEIRLRGRIYRGEDFAGFGYCAMIRRDGRREKIWRALLLDAMAAGRAEEAADFWRATGGPPLPADWRDRVRDPRWTPHHA